MLLPKEVQELLVTHLGRIEDDLNALGVIHHLHRAGSAPEVKEAQTNIIIGWIWLLAAVITDQGADNAFDASERSIRSLMQ